jgi:hypothetical protein
VNACHNLADRGESPAFPAETQQTSRFRCPLTGVLFPRRRWSFADDRAQKCRFCSDNVYTLTVNPALMTSDQAMTSLLFVRSSQLAFKSANEAVNRSVLFVQCHDNVFVCNRLFRKHMRVFGYLFAKNARVRRTSSRAHFFRVFHVGVGLRG